MFNLFHFWVFVLSFSRQQMMQLRVVVIPIGLNVHTFLRFGCHEFIYKWCIATSTLRCGYDGKRQPHFFVPGFFIHIHVQLHAILLSADPVLTPHDFHSPSVCLETICRSYAMHVCFSFWQCVHFFITSMSWRILEVRVMLWGIGQHHVMLSTGQACSAFSLSMARTSLRTSTMPWLWWPSPFRSSLRRRISQSLLEAVLAIQTSGRLAHSSNGEARDERWLAFASFPTNHPFAIMHYHTLPLVWHWQEWKLSHHKHRNR